jgi:hypothetical protein
MGNIFKIAFGKCPPRTHLIGLLLTNRICHIFIAPTFLFRMVKTAALYLVPIKSYSIYNHVSFILKRIVVLQLGVEHSVFVVALRVMMNWIMPPDETLKQGRNRSWLLVKFAFRAYMGYTHWQAHQRVRVKASRRECGCRGVVILHL